MRILLLVLTLFSSIVLAEPTHEFHLDNGLHLVVKEDHRAPVVVSQIWYKVGSSYEYGGITGVSHALEHMMFKGTQKYPAGKFDHIMTENGAKQNAATSSDVTFYYQELPRDKLRLSFEMEADRMRGLLLNEEEFKKEIKVIHEERRLRTEDNPFMIAYERFNAAAFVSSPYRHPVVGWMNDLEHMTIHDLRSWYKTWYAPNNATVVVVGDVNPQEVLALAKEYFGSLPVSKINPPKPQIEIPARGEKKLIINEPAKVPVLLMGYNVPSLNTASPASDAYALEVIAAILDGGASARLEKEEVRGRQLVSKVQVQYDLYARMSTTFLLYGIPAGKHTLNEVQTAFTHQIKRLQTEPVSASELARIKAQVVAQKIYARDSLANQAEEIGRLESVGLPWKTEEKYVGQVQAVTAAQIQQVAKRYLTPDNLTVAYLEPTTR